MSFVDNLFAKFGYVKAQNVFPEPKDDRVINPNPSNSVTTYGAPPVSGAPEQLAGNPNSAQPNPQVNLEGAESTEVATPFNNQQQDPSGAPVPLQDQSVVPTRKVFDLEDVRAINPLVAQSMEKEGILVVDAEKFMQRYNAMWTHIATKKITISEYLNGKR